ncbi:MAG: alginate export family protein [Pseudomonas sp.]|nr:alginate export family protein [Pseudomonas sp.]
MHILKLSLLALAVGAGVSGQVCAAEDFSNIFTQGTPILDARYRYEYVDQNAVRGKTELKQADAQTLRTRLGFQTGKWYGLSSLIEADNVARVGSESFNSSRNGQKEYSVVADPDGTEINQALLRYDHKLGSAVAGRQRINLDNQRFIGSVAWRQNEQTYDGGLLQFKPISGLTLTAAYIDQINTIWGPENGKYANKTNPANIDGHSKLFNAQYVVMPELTVTGYSYLLDLDNIATNAASAEGTLSSQTSGLRLNGAISGVSYAVEYAQQSDYGDNPNDLDSNYYLAELGYTVATVGLKAGYEVLGGSDDGSSKVNNSNLAFQTPLATKHAFQGWADVFLTTPTDGIEDMYLGATAPLLGGTVQAVYHDYSARENSSNYGEELNLSYGHPIPGVKGLVALAKYAHYDSADNSISSFSNVDTQKFWLQLQYTYL